MNQEIPYAIGVGVECTDGGCGELVRVIIDPSTRSLAHLVVGGPRRPNRLVPVAVVDHADSEVVHLACDLDAFHNFDYAEETEFLSTTRDELGYPADRVLLLPYYPLGPYGSPGPETVTYDRVPAGEVQIRRGECVHATDGDVGRVQGLVVDGRDHHVTHILLAEGHLWGRKDVAIPVRAVTRMAPDLHVALTRDQVRDLPPVEVGSFD